MQVPHDRPVVSQKMIEAWVESAQKGLDTFDPDAARATQQVAAQQQQAARQGARQGMGSQQQQQQQQERAEVRAPAVAVA